MQVETLSIPYCMRGQDDEGCEELANFKLTSEGGSTVLLCADHAQVYLRNEKPLEFPRCAYCGNVCRPGYLVSQKKGKPYCTALHMEMSGRLVMPIPFARIVT